MPTRLQDCEDPRLRATWRAAVGTMYRRTYNVDPADLDALPAEGEVLPGETSALLGPFIVAGGIQFGQQRGAGGQTVTLTALTLDRESGQPTSGYVEIDRGVTEERPDATVFRTRGVALTRNHADRPRQGDRLAGESEDVAPICNGVAIDPDTYPGRYLFTALWDAPALRPGP